MCLIIFHHETADRPKPKTAKHNMIVFKGTGSDKIAGDTFGSYFMPFTYTRGVRQPRVRLKPFISTVWETTPWSPAHVRWHVECGYHAYTDLDYMWNTMWYPDNVGIFVIPKGSVYYEGACSDIVASSMIYLGRLEDCTKLPEKEGVTLERMADRVVAESSTFAMIFRRVRSYVYNTARAVRCRTHDFFASGKKR